MTPEGRSVARTGWAINGVFWVALCAFVLGMLAATPKDEKRRRPEDNACTIPPGTSE